MTMGPTHTQVGVPEEGEKGAARSFEEIIAKHFPNLMKDTNLKIQKAQQIPRRINSKGTTLRYSIMKLSYK